MATDGLRQRFSSPATRVLQFAQEEARRMGVNVVGTEHLLLGLIRDAEGIAGKVLGAHGVTAEGIRTEYARQCGMPGEPVPSGRLMLSVKAKKALEFALREEPVLNPMPGGFASIDTQHLLLGLLHVEDTEGNRAISLLAGLGVEADAVRAAIRHVKPDEPVAG